MMQRAQAQTANNQAGFSLLELIVVMGVLALALAVVAPRMGGTREKMQLKAAAMTLASDLRVARAAARAGNVTTALVLNAKRHTYVPYGTARRRIPDTLSINYEAQRSPGAADVALFSFNADGTASGGQIRLANRSERASISIDWLTGGVFLTWR